MKNDIFYNVTSIDLMFKDLGVTDLVKISSLVNYLSECIIFTEGDVDVEDRLEFIVFLLRKRTNEYKNLLKQ